MKRTTVRILATLLFAVLSGCLFSGDGSSPSPEAKERVLQLDSVLMITLEGVGSFETSGLYELELDSGFTYHIASWATGDLQTGIDVLDGDGTLLPLQVLSSFPRYPGLRETILRSVKRQPVLVRLSSPMRKVDVVFRATRRAGLEPGFEQLDAGEPNENPSNAQWLPTDSTTLSRSLHGTSHRSLDIDWYRVECDSGKHYTAILEYPVSAGNIEFAWFDANGDTLPRVQPPLYYPKVAGMFVRSFPLAPEIVRKETRLIRVSSTTGTWYRIAVSGKDSLSELGRPDRFEPESGPTQAARMDPTGTDDADTLVRTLHGTETTTNDTDWIVVQCDSGRRYVAEAKVIDEPQSTGVVVQLLDTPEFPTRKVEWNKYEVWNSGPRVFRVVSESGRRHKYAFIVSSLAGSSDTSAPDRFEPDQTMAQAKPLAVDGIWQNRTTRSRTFPANLDDDLIAIQADSGYEVRILIENLQSSLAPVVLGPDSIPAPFLDSSTLIRRVLFFPTTRKGNYVLRLGFDGQNHGYRISATATRGLRSGFVDPYESDPDPARALPLTAGSRPLSRASMLRDEDWFRFVADSGSVGSVKIRRTSGSAVLQTTLLSADFLNAGLDGWRELVEDAEVGLAFQQTSKETLYVRVRSVSNDAAAYEIGLEMLPARQ